MSTGGSRLAEMQARFQQKQLMEKEQKLLKMYEASQARVLGRLGTQASTAPTGKVRQMFEERRTKAGIDKSYPLQPLTGTHGSIASTQVKIARMTINGHQSTGDKRQDVTIEIKHSTNFNGDTVIKNQRIDMKTSKDINLNDNFDDSLDGNSPVLDSVANKLPNVGGSLPSQRTIKQNNNNGMKNGITSRKISDTPLKTNGDVTRDKPSNQRITKTPPLQAIKPNTLKTPKPQTTTPAVKSRSVTSPSQPLTSPATVKPKTPANPEDKPKSPVKSSPSPMAFKGPARKPLSPKSAEGNACRICQRVFAPDRIQKHEEICAKTSSKKRKPYDALKHRVAGTELQSYVRNIRKPSRGTVSRNAPAPRPNNWRKKHEEFIQAIRSAKQVQQHIKSGGKLSDLPPPPPSENPDYITCPHCNRRFNETAANRHIPKCANYEYNKPAARGPVRRR